MGRRRKPGSEWMPERVYLGKSAYEMRPAGGGCIKLCPLKASQRTVLRRYEEEMRKLEVRAGSVAILFGEYLESKQFNGLANSTKKKQRMYAETLEKSFGKMSAASIKPSHIRKYMDMRGQATEVTANREFSFLAKAFAWGYERGRVPANPCRGVRKFSEKPRDRYITDAEYSAVYAAADQVVRAAMEISYCCAARISDVLSITNDQLDDVGIMIKQGKTGKKQIKAWSPRLRDAVNAARSAQKTRSLTRVVANEKGQRITQDAFSHRWKKAKTKAAEQHPDMKFDFTFHDIKGRSISDYEGDKQRFSGHKSAQMVQTYDRKTEVVDTH